MSVEKEVPVREESSSPSEEQEKQHFRLLVVANRLPITIKMQDDVTPGANYFANAGGVQLQGVGRGISHRVVGIEEDDVLHLDWMDRYS
jgi:hypothetical protein